MQNGTIMMTGGSGFEGYELRAYSGMVSGDVVIRNGVFSDLGLEETAGANQMEQAEQFALQRLACNVATIPQVNAICQVSLSHTVLSAATGTILVTAIGTAVRAEPIKKMEHELSGEEIPSKEIPVEAAPINGTLVEEKSVEAIFSEQPSEDEEQEGNDKTVHDGSAETKEEDDDKTVYVPVPPKDNDDDDKTVYEPVPPYDRDEIQILYGCPKPAGFARKVPLRQTELIDY